ncbi:protein FAR1-RELATED SEQUENCE 5-like [Citrus clementina]|uniref:protein FAR1-RELATED SEQUENCE 5-like n=1 Tax=Citrus clementina TaxID=85681 RepID=UPI000CED26A2|nr:protein FAR1-RELATED SEQUENCE 5-like [Citrus x clementina]
MPENNEYLGNNGEEVENNLEQLEAPYVGMLFETLEQARNYYEDYGRQEGFWIRTRSSSKSRVCCNEVTSGQFTCAHQGKHVPKINKPNFMEEHNEKDASEVNTKKRSRNCSTVKCGCEASMRVMYDKWSNKWKITVFRDSHNHKVVTPARRIKMKSNKHMPKAAKNLTKAFHKENLPIAKVRSILGGSQMGFNNRDCYNHLRNVRHKQLDGGDAQSVLIYFRKKQAENPQFFYAIQCDEKGQATNFFWVDARSRLAYHCFGDVVSFDTTYRTNKYDMPFAPFTGVNHHLQSIQFGCALLQDETEVTFQWLFETWLEAMGGRPPISIITDQDLAMKRAIVTVFPNTHHRLCLWHIKKKFAEKLSHVYFKKSRFKIGLKKCIMSTYKVEEFEETWKSLIIEYKLEDNEWLNHLYEIRASWAPVYNRSIFFAGMNTTGRSEGINSFFDGFDEWSQVNRYKVEENGCDAEFLKYLVRTKFGESEEFMVKLNPQTYEEELEALRLSHMCHQATKLACAAASLNEAYLIYMDGINELAKKLLDISNQPATVCQQKDDPCFSISSSQPLLLDPNISQTKGRKKDVNNTGRIKSGIELALGKKKRKCNSCGKLGHDKRICPLNPSRKSIEISNPGKL